MNGDRENESMNFDSIPDIAFNSNGEPVTDFGMKNQDDAPKGFNGQFIPPAGMGVEEDNSFNNNNSFNSSNNDHHISEVPVDMNGDFNMFKCNDCNTVFGVSNGEVANKCIMCSSTNLSNVNYTDNNILGFVPFNVPKSKAIEVYKSKVMMNPIIPICFKTQEALDSIRKVYIPGYLYDTLTMGETNFLGVDDGPNGKVKYDVRFDNSVEHFNIFHKATSKINERVFNAVSNFKFNNIMDFDPKNIGQCFYLEPDLNKIDITNKVEDNCIKHVIALSRRKVKHAMKKVLDNTLRTDIKNIKSILVPVYMLNVRYGSKDYMYIMNGETGENSLDVTYGKLEMLIFGLLVALIVAGISVLITNLF